MLLGHGGNRVEVVDVTCHPPEIRKLTWLRTEDSSTLVVTSDHRILVRRGHEQQTIPAGNLCVGEVVLCAGGERRLFCVEHKEDLEVEVYQISFKPDVPMETFFDPGPILTQGFKRGIKNWRGGKNKRRYKRQRIPEERSEAPATFNPWK